MTTQQLAKVHSLRPFRPFRLYFADGGHADARHPEMLADIPSGRTAVLYSPDERVRFMDLLLISRIEILNGKRNGHRVRRRR